jgi:hypothetical protein
MKNADKNQVEQMGRRNFIAAASALSAGTAHAGVPGSQPPPSTQQLNSVRGASAFRAQLQSEFSLVALSGADATKQLVRLVQVAPSTYAHPELSAVNRDELTFSITLAASNAEFTQDTYALSHPVLGEFAALLVPSRNGRELTGIFHLAA